MLAGGSSRRLASAGEPLPPVAVLTVGEPDGEGDLLAAPENWDEETAPPTIRLSARGRFGGQIARGARVLARLARDPHGHYDATVIRVLPSRERVRLVGVVRHHPGEALHVVPSDRKLRGYFPIAPGRDSLPVREGDLVSAEQAPGPKPPAASRRLQDRTVRVRVTENLGPADAPGAISLISIHSAGIPTAFPEAAVAEAGRAEPMTLGRRTDLRPLPLVTIDGADARDFDDAVYAEPLEGDGKAAWRLVVAIADVSAYVLEGSALDGEAARRGNSTYFPDRVVPMLPEALSNDLCSLRPGEDRPVLFADIELSAEGTILSHKFGRGLIRSAARLIYEQVQAARDGAPDETCAPLMERVIGPLYGVFGALKAAREARHALDLDLTETAIELGQDGKVAAVRPRERLDAHRLIEECMIAANVCAAEALGRRNRPCLYRNHAAPGPEKIAAARDFLAPFGYVLPKTGVVTGKHLTQALARARGTPEQGLVNETILRAQAQAQYAPENIGHFGLGLRDYAHFTSPIRRYADLVVHRSLIAAFKLGEAGLSEESAARLGETGDHISFTERRSASAERDSVNRYMAAHLATRIGEEAEGTISGVTRFGLFVRLGGSMAEGLIPIARLPDDYYDFDDARQQLVGRRSGRTFTLGDTAAVRIREADPLTGSSLFDLLDSHGTREGRRRGGGKGGGKKDSRGGKRRPINAGRR